MLGNNKNIIEKFIESKSIGASAAKILLLIVASGGIVFAGAAMPGIFGAAKAFKSGSKFSKKQYRDAFYNLKKRKLIEIIDEKGGKSKVVLSLNGKKKIKEFDFDKLSIEKPKKWDRKWRVLIFDIPTTKTYNRARDAMRSKIKELGFFQLQRSVWIHPFPCEEEILFVAENYNVQKYIEMLTVEKLLHEEYVKSKFKKYNLS